MKEGKTLKIEEEELEFIYSYERNVSTPLKVAAIIICWVITFFLERSVLLDPYFYNGYIVFIGSSLPFVIFFYLMKNLKIVKVVSYLSFAHDMVFITFLLRFTGGVDSVLNLIYALFFIRAAVNYRTLREILFIGFGIFTPVYLIGMIWAEGGSLAIYGDKYLWVQYSFIWLVIISSFAIVTLLTRQKQEIEDNLKEIRRLQAQLIQSEKIASIGRLAAGLAHELNNPLSSILGFSQLLTKTLKEDDPKREDLFKIEKASIRCKKIIDSLLLFSRQRGTKFELTDLNFIIEETLPLCLQKLKKGDVELIKEYADDLPLVMADASQLTQVFVNLISNAVDAMEGKKEDEKKLTIRTGKFNDQKVFIEFIDTGCGIKKEYLDKVFDPFFTTKQIGEGIGLGLSISYGIIKNHDGEIRIESEEGKGTKFIVELPIKVQSNFESEVKRTLWQSKY